MNPADLPARSPAEPHCVRAGFDVPFEPFAFVSEGTAQGMMIDLVRHLIERTGRRAQMLPMHLPDCEPALAEGHIEALAFKGVTPERLTRMDFSDPLILSGGATFTRAGLAPSTRLADFDGMRAATTRNGPFWSLLEREHPRIARVHGETYEQCLDKVVAGEADLAVLNLQAGTWIARKAHPGRIGLPDQPCSPLTVSFCMMKGRHPALMADINAALAAARADGTWQAIHDRWLA
jgi:ABC-type amino acid transport substrate-binding protein